MTTETFELFIQLIDGTEKRKKTKEIANLFSCHPIEEACNL